MSSVFLVIFFVGLALTATSVVLGAIDASGIGHGGGHAGHVGDMGHAGHAGHIGDMGHAGHADVSGAHADQGPHGANAVSPINYQSIVAFLMGFGGVGYLVSRAAWGVLVVALVLATLGGMATGSLIVKWMRFLVRSERPLPSVSYVGLVGQLTVGIREGGTGELVYSLHGTRMVTSARSADGRPIAKGEQVVVLRYENGVAYVEPMQQLMGSSSQT
jgi:hypothetical protein